jgi:hypothetical protein
MADSNMEMGDAEPTELQTRRRKTRGIWLEEATTAEATALLAMETAEVSAEEMHALCFG